VRPMAESLLIALLMARRQFGVPRDIGAAESALGNFRRWFPEVIQRLEEDCRTTSFGTRFEDRLRATALRRLGISPEMNLDRLVGSYIVSST
jgi:hypothetical protein